MQAKICDSQHHPFSERQAYPIPSKQTSPKLASCFAVVFPALVAPPDQTRPNDSNMTVCRLDRPPIWADGCLHRPTHTIPVRPSQPCFGMLQTSQSAESGPSRRLQAQSKGRAGLGLRWGTLSEVHSHLDMRRAGKVVKQDESTNIVGLQECFQIGS